MTDACLFLLRVALVSKQFCRLAAGKYLWRELFIRDQRDTLQFVESEDAKVTDW